jgi:hypothetical protein
LALGEGGRRGVPCRPGDEVGDGGVVEAAQCAAFGDVQARAGFGEDLWKDVGAGRLADGDEGDAWEQDCGSGLW